MHTAVGAGVSTKLGWNVPELPDEIVVRVATPADEPAVNALLAASYPALMRESYEAAVLAAALPMITQANPALLSSGT